MWPCCGFILGLVVDVVVVVVVVIVAVVVEWFLAVGVVVRTAINEGEIDGLVGRLRTCCWWRYCR